MKNTLKALQQIIQSVLPEDVIPEDLLTTTQEPEIIIKNEVSEKPIELIEGNLVVYAGSKLGAALAADIFKYSTDLMNTGERTIEKDFAALISNAEPYSEMVEQDKLLIAELTSIVPMTDIQIIEDALFIRRMFRNNVSVSDYKNMMYVDYGSRGNNISNLVSADYYEKHIIPIAKHIKETEEDPGIAQSIFSEFYEEAVTQYPFAVFVSRSRSVGVIEVEIRTKIQLNLASDQHILNIHGIGEENKKKIKKILLGPDLQKLYTSEPFLVSLKGTIYGRIYF